MKSLLKGYKLDKMKMNRMLLAFILGMFLISFASANVIVNSPVNGSTTIFPDVTYNLTMNYTEFKNVSLINNVSGGWDVNKTFDLSNFTLENIYTDINQYEEDHTYDIPDAYINYSSVLAKGNTDNTIYMVFYYTDGTSYTTPPQSYSFSSFTYINLKTQM